MHARLPLPLRPWHDPGRLRLSPTLLAVLGEQEACGADVGVSDHLGFQTNARSWPPVDGQDGGLGGQNSAAFAMAIQHSFIRSGPASSASPAQQSRCASIIAAVASRGTTFQNPRGGFIIMAP